MNALGVLQILLYIAVLVALVKPLGTFMAKVYDGERTFLSPVLGPIERGIYRLAGIRPWIESSWKRYALALLLPIYVAHQGSDVVTQAMHQILVIEDDASIRTVLRVLLCNARCVARLAASA